MLLGDSLFFLPYYEYFFFLVPRVSRVLLAASTSFGLDLKLGKNWKSSKSGLFTVFYPITINHICFWWRKSNKYRKYDKGWSLVFSKKDICLKDMSSFPFFLGLPLLDPLPFLL